MNWSIFSALETKTPVLKPVPRSPEEQHQTPWTQGWVWRERCTARWPAGPLWWCTHPGWLAVSCKRIIRQPCSEWNPRSTALARNELGHWKWQLCFWECWKKNKRADLRRRVCCLLRMEGLDSKMWGLFLFLPVATAAAAAIPTGPDK